MLEAFGSCRLCLVEIEGCKGYPASCTTLVEPGMKVRTQTPKLADLRRGVMELYISDHPLDCLTCPANGNCELQEMAGVVGLRDVRYGYDGANRSARREGHLHPYFTFDPTKCIVCSRCVRACEGLSTFALTVDSRGFASVIAAGPPTSWRRMRLVRSLRAGLPRLHADGKSIIDNGQPIQRDHHVRLLRRGLLIQGRDEAPKSCAWFPTRTVAPITVTPASKAASRGATLRIPTASARR
jgi:formate dehydrogenase major subunit